MGYGYLYGELKKSDSATYCEVTVLQEVKSSLFFSKKNKLIILIFVLFFRQKIFSQTMSKPAFFKYLCLAFAFSGCLHAQNCDNLDFARGNFNGWTGKSWIYTVYPDWSTNTLPVTGTATGRLPDAHRRSPATPPGATRPDGAEDTPQAKARAGGSARGSRDR